MLCLCSHLASLQTAVPSGVGGGSPGWQVTPAPILLPTPTPSGGRGQSHKGKCEKMLMGQDTDGLTRERNSHTSSYHTVAKASRKLEAIGPKPLPKKTHL